MFVHLHGHSDYSLLEAIGKVSKIVDAIKKMGMETVALTDYFGMYGVIEFYKAAKKAGIKPLIGVELGLVHDVKFHKKGTIPGNICLLAKNLKGYYNLIELVSLANTTGSEDKPKIDLAQLKQYHEGLIGFAGGTHSFIGMMYQQQESEKKIQDMVEVVNQCFEDGHFFLELIVQDYRTVPTLRALNESIEKIANSLSLKCIVDNNFHYINYGDKEAFEVALCVKDGVRTYEPQKRTVVGQQHIFSEEEIINVLKVNGYTDDRIQEFIATNQYVADIIDLKLELGLTLFPNYVSPESIKNLYVEHQDHLISS